MKHFKKLSRRIEAFTLIELLVVISIITILAGLTLQNLPAIIAKGQITGTMGNYRQIYMATQNASLEAQTAGSTNAGFPADIGGVEAWSNSIISNNYLSDKTFAKMMSVKGNVANTKVYNVGSTNDPNTVFIACANLSANGVAPSPAYGSYGGAFVTLSGQAVTVNGSNAIAQMALTNGIIWAQ